MTDDAEQLPDEDAKRQLRERLQKRIQERLTGVYRCQCGWGTCTPGPVGSRCSCGFYRMYEVEEDGDGADQAPHPG